MTPRRPVSIGLVQMAMGPDRSRNVAAAEEGIAAAAAAGAQIVCLPELFATEYFAQVEDPGLCDLAEPVPGPTTERMAQLAARLGVVLIVPVFERRAAGLYHNSAVVIDVDGRQAALYRKMHIPDDPAYYEKFYFTPGDTGYLAADTRFGRIGVLICWDQWFPEAARLTALAGAEILFYPTAIGWHPAEKATIGERQREAWMMVQRGHAIANGLFVVAVNRVGQERPAHAPGDGLEFWGSSFVAGPFGQMLLEANAVSPAVLTVEVDLREVETQRRGWPLLRDRRVETYSGLMQRFLDAAPNFQIPKSPNL